MYPVQGGSLLSRRGKPTYEHIDEALRRTGDQVEHVKQRAWRPDHTRLEHSLGEL